ncbi:brorin-like [Biomphalaria glabrata]|uniref:Brorin-like n=1 Tax=Biomphalaria glabrata TaxID=6526 RepID=A0A9W3BN14_BIOGL|nr:brorin-like [Biomphalaria glabrata]
MSSAGIVCLILLAATFCLAQNERNCVLPTGEILREGEITDGDCLPCFCYRGSLVCATVQCQSTPCVDYDILPGECCPSCPNGPNCLLPDGGILAAGQSTTLNDGRTCTCVAHGHYPTELDCGSRSWHG